VVDSTLHIDTSDIRKKIYYKYGRPAVDILVAEMRTAFQDSGKIAQHEANVLITGGEESNLAKASTVTVRESARDISAIVSWDGARSATGFPYAASVNTGRKAFGPITAKALRFEIDGEVIYTKWVRAFPGIQFTKRGTANARPKIIARMTKMQHNVHRRLAAP